MVWYAKMIIPVLPPFHGNENPYLQKETRPNNYLGSGTPQKLAIVIGAQGLINLTLISHTSHDRLKSHTLQLDYNIPPPSTTL